MTDMTEQDAARLAEIRGSNDRYRMIWPRAPETVREFLLRLLDAAARPHDASFVTREKYDAMVALKNKIADQANKSDADADVAEAACARHVTAYDEVARRVADLEAILREVLTSGQQYRKDEPLTNYMTNQLIDRIKAAVQS